MPQTKSIPTCRQGIITKYYRKNGVNGPLAAYSIMHGMMTVNATIESASKAGENLPSRDAAIVAATTNIAIQQGCELFNQVRAKAAIYGMITPDQRAAIKIDGGSLSGALAKLGTATNEGDYAASFSLIQKFAESSPAFSNLYHLADNMNEDIANKGAQFIDLSRAKRGAAMESRQMLMQDLEGRLSPTQRKEIASKKGLMSLLKDLDGNDLQRGTPVRHALNGVAGAEEISSMVTTSSAMFRATSGDPAGWDEWTKASCTVGIADAAKNRAKLDKDSNVIILMNRRLRNMR